MRDHAIGAFGADGARARPARQGRRARRARRRTARVLASASPRVRSARRPSARARRFRVRAATGSGAAFAVRGCRWRCRGPLAVALCLAAAGLHGLGSRRSRPPPLALGLLFRRWLGGVTGDVLGATAELSETLALVAAASCDVSRADAPDPRPPRRAVGRRPCRAGAAALDVELSAAGHEHARRLAGRLTGEPVAAIATSPLRARLATAAPLAAALGLDPVAVDDLRELDFGELDGLRFEAVVAALPRARELVRPPSAVSLPGRRERRRRPRPHPRARRGYGRGTRARRRRLRPRGPIRAVLADALPLQLEALFRLERPRRLSIVEWHEGTPVRPASTHSAPSIRA